ncbi:MAG: GxxExxY protein [bacterium]|nr:GxxExxY protein [Patescibacteria group bacterium]
MEIEFEELSSRIINAAIAVHKELGPGFLESIYEEALSIELGKQGIRFERQKEVKIYYDQKEIGIHRIDLLVEKEIIVELKAIKDFEDIHFAQLKSYLKATNLKVGLLLNFAKTTLSIKRVVL